MQKRKEMTFQESLDLDENEFNELVMDRYKESQPDGFASKAERHELFSWTRDSRINGAWLEQFLTGSARLFFDEGDLIFEQIPEQSPSSARRVIDSEADSFGQPEIPRPAWACEKNSRRWLISFHQRGNLPRLRPFDD